MTRKILVLSLILLMLVTGCDLLNAGKNINIIIIDNSVEKEISVPSGSSVKQALETAGVMLNGLDKTDPITTTLLSENTTISITRVTEDFLIEQAIVPFEQQNVKNESLPEGQSLLIQAGANGIQQNTWRILYENGVETSRTFVSSEISQPAKPEIVMIGVQSPFSPQIISGIIAYISSSNAWVMETSTINRRLVVSTADLDGRVFSISPDGEWLLFSRLSGEDNVINTLWIVNLKSEASEPISTGINNVVNYADWVPGRGRTIAFSTVDPVPTAPGWNANNDLLLYRFDIDGKPLETKLVVDKNSLGISPWWGVSYEWSTDGSKVAYSRPDSIGLVDLETGSLIPLVEFDDYATGGDWAWVPGIKWSPDDQAIFTTLLPSASENPLTIPVLSAILVDAHKVITLVTNCGLFCYPTPSPLKDDRYVVAYLGAILPDQSETSRYNLKIMDRDSSNQRKYYPEEGIQGLEPQILKWSPSWSEDQLLAGIAQGNMILVNTDSGSVKQITADGSISKIDWK